MEKNGASLHFKVTYRVKPPRKLPFPFSLLTSTVATDATNDSTPSHVKPLEAPLLLDDIAARDLGGGVVVNRGDAGDTGNASDLSKPSPSLARQKTILRDVQGFIPPGRALAIMGQSGAGKTSLLDIIAGRIPMRTSGVAGTVLIDGVRIADVNRGDIGYVPQEPHCIPTMTVRETLTVAAQLRMPTDHENPRDRATQVRERVTRVLSELGLAHVADTFVGGGRVRGVSGGERKRVTIGTALVTDPKILFLDEPTSGLDSLSAEGIVNLLTSLARTRGTTVVFSIHQPRSNIFAAFDGLALMAHGRLVFIGEASRSVPFVETVLGKECPPRVNGADHIIDVVGAMEPAALDAVAASGIGWGGDESLVFSATGDTAQSYLARKSRRGTDRGAVASATGRGNTEYAVSFLSQLWILLRRDFLSTVRNPALTMTQLMQSLVMGLVVGSMWNDINTNKELSQLSALFFISTYISMMCFSACPYLLEIRKVFAEERFAGSYRVSALVLAKTLSDVLPYALNAFVFGSLVFYFAGLDHATYPRFVLLCVVEIQVGVSIIFFVSSVSSSMEMSLVVATLTNGLLLLYSGFLVPVFSIPPYYLPIYYISYVQMTLSALAVNQFGHGSPFLKQFFFGEHKPPHLGRSLIYLAAALFFFRSISYIVLRIKTRK